MRTMLMDFASVEAGAQTVSAIIAADGPCGPEMMDQLCVRAVEEYIHAGLRRCGRHPLVEVAGPARSRPSAAHVDIGIAHGVERTADEAERALLWKGRKNVPG